MKYTISAKKMVSEEKPISLIVDNKSQAEGETIGCLGFSWLFYYPLLVLTCGLLMPQTTGQNQQRIIKEPAES